MIAQRPSVLVLTHSDIWGTLSANQLIMALRKNYPDVLIYLIASRATRNSKGDIVTKLEGLKIAREIRDTCFGRFMDHIDALPEEKKKSLRQDTEKMRTLEALSRDFCADKMVHYTTTGGKKGGEEVEIILKAYSIRPEVVLSVDTMAILPASVTERYDCFSTHPGPLSTIKVEGMQGTLRSLAHKVFYDEDGRIVRSPFLIESGQAFVQGSLFLQHAELDKGPVIQSVNTSYTPGDCAFDVRRAVYHDLVLTMIGALDTMLDPTRRKALIEHAQINKQYVDEELKFLRGARVIPHLEEEDLARWRSDFHIIQEQNDPEVRRNRLIDPGAFKYYCSLFFPGTWSDDFQPVFEEIFGDAFNRLYEQEYKHLKAGIMPACSV